MRKDYERSDLHVVIDRVDDRWQVTVGGERLPLTGADDLDFIAAYLKDLIHTRPTLFNAPGRHRVLLDIRDAHARSFDWEGRWGSDPIPVRVSPVRPRILGHPFTLPVRIIAVDHEPGFLADAVYQVFQNHDRTDVEKAVIVRGCALADFPAWQAPFAWPVAEVLDFARLPFEHEPERQLSHAASRVGTLGWMARVAERLRTRLIVLQADHPAARDLAIRLATGLVGRGGPAVLVRTNPQSAANFYGDVIHDFPFDFAFQPSQGEILFAGSGREELLRVSDVGMGLLALQRERRQAAEKAEEKKKARNRFEQIRGGLSGYIGIPAAPTPEEPPQPRLDEELASFAGVWTNLNFEFHEGNGLLPMARHIDRVRDVLPPAPAPAAAAAQSPPRTAPQTRSRSAKKKRAREQRAVNGSLGRVSGGNWSRLDPQRDRLDVGAEYELAIRIGEQDTTLVTAGAVGFADEQIGWKPDQDGIWIEIAVSGIGICLTGAEVQELWVPPPAAATDPVYFPFVVRDAGAVSLRYTLFYRGNVLQSFRLAALSGTPTAKDRALLAEALAIPEQQVKEGATYVARLEYTGEPLNKAADAPPKTLALVVNRGSGMASVDVKGDEFFVSHKSRSLPGYVQRARTALLDISSTTLPGIARERWPYAFGAPGDANAGSDEKLKESLEKLATTGWQLFDQLFREPRKPMLDALEAAQEADIGVAHILLENVIPWAAIYDRLYTPDVETIDGVAVKKDVCLAALPGSDGKLPFTTCGTSPNCVLNDPSMHEQTVVCPLHFWGFRHVIDVPPQQTTDGHPEGHPPRLAVKAGSSANVAVAVNAVLPRANTHLQELETLRTELPMYATVFGTPRSKADELLTALKSRDLDVIYFYCHARGGTYDPSIDPPCLELQESDQAAARRLTSDQFAYSVPWDHDPLVILNGCSTAGFSPDALSPFIEKFVLDRGASGVLGTEVPVHEPFAGEMAIEFLRRFLAGRPAGQSLLEVRRLLLGRKNPLGLVYTLYADSRLTLTRRTK